MAVHFTSVRLWLAWRKVSIQGFNLGFTAELASCEKPKSSTSLNLFETDPKSLRHD